MQSEGSSGGSSNIFKKPEHILLFVQQSLSGLRGPHESQKRCLSGVTGLVDLHITKADQLDMEDSDDEESGISEDDEITETSIDLLLAILEGAGRINFYYIAWQLIFCESERDLVDREFDDFKQDFCSS